MDRPSGEDGHPLADLYPETETPPVVGDEYRPIRPMAKWATILLAIAVVLDVVAFFSGLSERSLLGQDVITPSEADTNDNRQDLIALAQLIALIVTAFFFIRWLHRGYKNLRELGTVDLRYKTGWAIGSWFVPILNLWRPKQIVNDVWRASAPDLPPRSAAEWRVGDVPGWVTLWWGTFLVSNWASELGSRYMDHADTRGELRTANGIDLLATVVDVVAGIAAILLVQRLTARQEERAARISNDAAA